MVLCLIFGCGNRTDRDKGVSFSRVPAIVTNQGEETQKLSELRRNLWISAISRADLTESLLDHGRVCGKHFTSGIAAKSWDRYNPDWVPSLHLGHNKKLSGEKLESALDVAAKRDLRARSLDKKCLDYERLKENKELNDKK